MKAILAIDIGTTTVSALLIDMKDGHIFAKASSGNGQIRFGADVINRIVETTKAPVTKARRKMEKNIRIAVL